MARFTVSDCMDNIPNRYALTLSASIRARQIENGSEILLLNGKDGGDDKDDEEIWAILENDKAPVLALREIAEGYVDIAILNSVE